MDFDERTGYSFDEKSDIVKDVERKFLEYTKAKMKDYEYLVLHNVSEIEWPKYDLDVIDVQQCCTTEQ